MTEKLKPHICHAFDVQLEQLDLMLSRMGGLAEANLAAAIRAVDQRMPSLAWDVINSDEQIDRHEKEIAETTVRLLALRQPVGSDLRHALATIKIVGNLERIGDYAKNIAKRSIVLSAAPPLPATGSLIALSRPVERLLRDVLDAYIDRDAGTAEEVWHRDEDVDVFYDGVLRELRLGMAVPDADVNGYIELLFIAKNLERIGDLCTNIAEAIMYEVSGHWAEEPRPKGAAV